jgi:hypothetical protein
MHRTSHILVIMFFWLLQRRAGCFGRNGPTNGTPNDNGRFDSQQSRATLLTLDGNVTGRFFDDNTTIRRRLDPHDEYGGCRLLENATARGRHVYVLGFQFGQGWHEPGGGTASSPSLLLLLLRLVVVVVVVDRRGTVAPRWRRMPAGR